MAQPYYLVLLVSLGVLGCLVGYYLYSQSTVVPDQHWFSSQLDYLLLGLAGLLIMTAALVAFTAYRHVQNLLLSQQASFYREVAETSFDSMISVDARHRIVLCSSGVENSFGYTPEELIGQPLSLLIPDSTKAVHEKLVSIFLKDGVSHAKQMGVWRQVKGRKKSGEEFPIIAKIARHAHSYNGAVASVSVRDMSEHDMREELLASSLREMERANNRLRAFFALFTHELRTPLNAIIGFSELATHHLNSGNADTVVEYLEYVSQGADRLNKLVMDVLDYRHIDEIAAMADFETINVHDLISKAVARFRRRHEEVDLKIEVLAPAPQLTLAPEIADEYFDLLFNLIFHRMQDEKSLTLALTDNAIELWEKGDYALSAAKSIHDELVSLYNLKLEDVLHFADQMDIRIFSLWKLGDLLSFKFDECAKDKKCIRILWDWTTSKSMLRARLAANAAAEHPQAQKGSGRHP